MRPPQLAPSYLEVIGSGSLNQLAKVLRNQEVSPADGQGRYLHWDLIRRHEPPPGFDLREWWAAIRFSRARISTQVLALTNTYGRPFSFANIGRLREALHRFDRGNRAKALLLELSRDGAVDEYRVSQIIEEAISSSEIEGAKPTTRELARQLVREHRKPGSKSERMILNNWRAMRQIVEWKREERDLTLEGFLELHRILGQGALDTGEDSAGKLRAQKHDVSVSDDYGEVWHTPPPAVDSAGGMPPLEQRVKALLAFAQDRSSENDAFIHPILRAMICHFWVGYEHPFRDGNGRLARALFYWVMLRNGYEMAEFLSISGPIDRKPLEYYRAFAYVETDDGDLTYFLLNQIDVLEEALVDLRKQIERRVKNLDALSKFVADQSTLNYRQRALLQKAVHQPKQSFSVGGHAESHGVHPNTARTDLRDLVKRRYLREVRVGKAKHYRASPKLLRGARS